MTESLWKELFDSLDQRIGPMLDRVAKSRAVTSALKTTDGARRDYERRVASATRRVSQRLERRTGTTVRDLASQVAQLESEVGALRARIAEHERSRVADRPEADGAEQAAVVTVGSAPEALSKSPSTKRRPGSAKSAS